MAPTRAASRAQRGWTSAGRRAYGAPLPRPTPAWTAADTPDLRERTAVVTGANIGLGLETTRELAHKGACVVMACRSEDRGRRARAEVVREVPDADLDVEVLDLASLDSVRQFAQRAPRRIACSTATPASWRSRAARPPSGSAPDRRLVSFGLIPPRYMPSRWRWADGLRHRGARGARPAALGCGLQLSIPMRTLSLFAALLLVAGCDSSSGVAEADSMVTVAYEGRLEDGTVFDRSDRATFSLVRTIPGFRDGVVGMAVGETRTFSIPPEEAYGANPPRGSIIPPNATLIFEVTLLDIG